MKTLEGLKVEYREETEMGGSLQGHLAGLGGQLRVGDGGGGGETGG